MKSCETTAYRPPTHLVFSQEVTRSAPRFSAGAIDALMQRPTPIWKRSLDLAISLACLLCIFPFVYLVLAVFIKIVSPNGPILFRQQRVGAGGKLFTFLKFRTMHTGNNEQDHDAYMGPIIKAGNKPMIKLDDHPRVIPLGKIIRKTCIDELPQLINVIRGEMSIVGPRPCIPYERDCYLRWHNERFDVLPGLTGLWQVSGKNKLSFQEMIRLDISYARNLSLWLDLKIILKTPFAILEQVWEAVAKKLAWQANTSQQRAFRITASDVPEARYAEILKSRHESNEMF